MRETFTSGSVGRAPGNRCLYPESDAFQPPRLRRSGFQARLTPSVRLDVRRRKCEHEKHKDTRMTVLQFDNEATERLISIYVTPGVVAQRQQFLETFVLRPGER